MSIKKITNIKNMAVFKNFDWDSTVKDKSNMIHEFKKINILYGRNYSGKTTISRIIRALETSSISDKYLNPEFQIETDGQGSISLNNISSHSMTVRVFNEDFIKENLRFLINETDDIQSFAILGDKNLEIGEAIRTNETELGTEEPPIGLLGKLKGKQEDLSKVVCEVTNKRNRLDDQLKRKANDEIKRNPDYSDVNYDIRKIRTDIATIFKPDFKDIDSDVVSQLRELLKEEPKPRISEVSLIDLKLDELFKKTKALIERKITLTNPIQELVDNALLESWVRDGIKHHKEKRSTCGFCGGPLPSDLIERLEKHFSEESEGLLKEIENLIADVEIRIKNVDSVISFDITQFYASEKDSISILENRFKEFAKNYRKILNQLIGQLKRRIQSISSPITFVDQVDISSELTNILNNYNGIIKSTNEKTNTLSSSQSQARESLRLYEVSLFLQTIKFVEITEEIRILQKKMKEEENALKEVNDKVTKCKVAIDTLKAELQDEKMGAEQVNKYLSNYFGHNALRLEPIQDSGENGRFKFEIQRNGQRAFHLSEGECSLVAFCYFMAKLDDINTKGNEPIIWIDDPISSLDANHVFFIYSLINGEIVKAKRFKQLFISTHNLDFLKYLKRLVADKEYCKSVQNFYIQRSGDESVIKPMPEYMVKYVTEFNYLFHKIYQCANADLESDSDSTLFYDYGNNMRKFLELFLAFKYPNPSLSDRTKLEQFLGGGCVETLLVDRINNEYSHLCGIFERAITMIDIPEMKKTAQFILRKIDENDHDQYIALLGSIGESPTP